MAGVEAVSREGHTLPEYGQGQHQGQEWGQDKQLVNVWAHVLVAAGHVLSISKIE